MSPTRAFAIAGRLGLATSLALFGLIVIGSLVRTTGSGLACPDWPLCQGSLIPPFDFHVFIEWLHRTVALVTSVLLFATAGWVLARRTLRPRLGGLAMLAVTLLLAQVLLGALTVWKLLHPAIVSSHLAVALLLFATLLTLTLVAESNAEPLVDARSVPARPPGLLPLLGSAATLTFAQAVLGGLVSSQHAGLVCPDWPACNGRWFPPLDDPAGLHMLHRYGGYLVTVVTMAAAFRARSAPDAGVRAGAAMALGLTLTQVVLGVCNVLLGVPPWLSALHLATAAALLGMLLAVSYRAARLPAAAVRLAAATTT